MYEENDNNEMSQVIDAEVTHEETNQDSEQNSRSPQDSSSKDTKDSTGKSLKFAVGVGLLVIIAIIVGFVLFSKPNAAIKTAFLDVGAEFKNTLNDFTPDMALGDMIYTSSQSGVYDVTANLDTTVAPIFTPFGNKSTFKMYLSSKSDPEQQKSAFSLGIDMGKLNFSTDVVAVGQELFVDAPKLYDKPFKVNLKAIGQDVANSPGKNDLQGLIDENLVVDLFAQPNTMKQYRQGLQEFAAEEIKQLEDNAKITDMKDIIGVTQTLANLGIDREIKAYDIKLNAVDIKSLLKKSIDYSIMVNETKINPINPKVKEDAELQKTKVDELDLPEIIDLEVYLSNRNLLGISFLNTNTSNLTQVYLLGEKNTTDYIVIFSGPQDAQDITSLKFDNQEGKHTFTIASTSDLNQSGDLAKTTDTNISKHTGDISDDESEVDEDTNSNLQEGEKSNKESIVDTNSKGKANEKQETSEDIQETSKSEESDSTDGEKTEALFIDDMKKLISLTHDGTNATFTSNFNKEESVEMSFTEIQKGTSFKMHLTSLPINSNDTEILNLSGDIYISVANPQIQPPESAQEVLKFDDTKYQEFKTTLVDNSNKAAGAFLMNLLTGGNYTLYDDDSNAAPSVEN